MMWKILNGKVSDEIDYLLVCCRLFLEEGKGYHKGIRGTNDLLNILTNIPSKKPKKGLKMKHRIIKCLNMYNVSDKIINLNVNPKENWWAKLTTRRQTLAEVKIQRGIFQRDSIWTLLFVIAMVPFNYLLRKYVTVYKYTKWKANIITLCSETLSRDFQ